MIDTECPIKNHYFYGVHAPHTLPEHLGGGPTFKPETCACGWAEQCPICEELTGCSDLHNTCLGHTPNTIRRRIVIRSDHNNR